MILFLITFPCQCLSHFNALVKPTNNTFHRVIALHIDESFETAFGPDGTTVSFSQSRRAVSCLSQKPKLPLTVYVIDTGCRVSHVQLVNKTIAFPAPASPFLSGDDDHGHGTHVAAKIAGRHFGIAPHARVVCIKALSRLNQGSSTHVVSAIRLVIRKHRKRSDGSLAIMCVSLGVAATRHYVDLDRAVTRAAQYGIVTIVAAGNSGRDACDFTPARAVGAITVAATRDDGKLASFSNWGQCITVGAPGVNIWSAVASTDDSYGMTSGTSMAAPFVSGIVALIQSETGGTSREFVVRALQAMSKLVNNVHVVSVEGFCEWVRQTRLYSPSSWNESLRTAS